VQRRAVHGATGTKGCTRSMKGVLSLSALACTVVAFSTSPSADTTPAVAQVLAVAGEYVTRFEGEFREIISDEEYEQKVSSPRTFDVRRRKLGSEMVFMWSDDQRTWVTVRNILNVDGRRLEEADSRLERLLSDPSLRLPTVRTLRESGSRFNIGTIQRTTNDPNLALLFLDPIKQARFAFKVRGREKINGAASLKLTYEERYHPTVIQDGGSGADLIARGAIWLDELDGAILRTEVGVELVGGTQATVTVDYGRDPRFSVLTPARMQEKYIQWDMRHDVMTGPFSTGSRLLERVECLATYTNFRRFETTARVLPQP
jgi:hypothetical protein